MADESEQDTIARIAERLRKDHPDPAIRAEMYTSDKLAEYVRTLARDVEGAAFERIIDGVKRAEDGTPAHDE